MIKAEWKKLILANYIVDPKVLTPYLPYKTEFDRLHQECFMSLVGFMFLNTKILGFKFPFHVNFEEVNLRFYVKYFHEGLWKRGVVFIKEIVPLPGIVIVANKVYHEHYQTQPMKHTWEFLPGELNVSYQWKHKDWNTLGIFSGSHPHSMGTGSEEMFFTDQHWGYTRIHPHLTYEYNVAHPAWQYYETKKSEIHVEFESLYGKEFAFLTHQKPYSVFLAEGSAITLKKSAIIRK
ncbi:MAG: DUF2071 domain-containing protein [Saprospiraceae bacterium]